MSKFVKNEKGYEKSFDADWKAVKKGLKKGPAEVGEPKKVPTSVALDPRFVLELKKRGSVPRHSLSNSYANVYC